MSHKLPSQRMAEEKAREEHLDTDAYSDEEIDAMQRVRWRVSSASRSSTAMATSIG